MQGVPRGVPPRVRGGTPWGTPADPEGYPRGPWGVPLGVPQTPQRVPRADPTQPCGVPPGVAHARGYPPRTLPCVVPYPAGYPFWGYPRGYPQKGLLGHRESTCEKKKKIFFFFEIFEKSADFATNFGWGISTTKGSLPPVEKNANWREFHTLIVSRQFAPISVFFREKTAKYKTRIGANWGNQGRILGYLRCEGFNQSYSWSFTPPPPPKFTPPPPLILPPFSEKNGSGQNNMVIYPPPLGIGARRVKTTRQLAQIRPTTRPFFLGELFFFGIFYGYKNTGTQVHRNRKALCVVLCIPKEVVAQSILTKRVNVVNLESIADRKRGWAGSACPTCVK